MIATAVDALVVIGFTPLDWAFHRVSNTKSFKFTAACVVTESETVSALCNMFVYMNSDWDSFVLKGNSDTC